MWLILERYWNSTHDTEHESKQNLDRRKTSSSNMTDGHRKGWSVMQEVRRMMWWIKHVQSVIYFLYGIENAGWVVEEIGLSEIWRDRLDFKWTAFGERRWVERLDIIEILIKFCHYKSVVILMSAIVTMVK